MVGTAAWDGGPAPPDSTETFKDRGFTLEQFTEFRDNYSVLHHQPDTGSGFSATLLQDRSSGELHLAFRGTNDAADYAKDAALALSFATRIGEHLQNGAVTDFLRDAGILDEAGRVRAGYTGAISLTGHSLGGYLALWTAQEYPELVSRVDTFNGAGLEYGSPLLLMMQELWLNIASGSGVDPGRIHNYYAEPGIELTSAGLFAYRPGEHLPLFIEDQLGTGSGLLGNHSMARLVDTLAAYRLFAALDPTLSLEDIGTILGGSSNAGVGSIATATIALGDALGEAYAGVADPVELYNRLREGIASGEWAGLHIESLAGRDVAAAALEDSVAGSAYRFALQNLHAFALIDDGAASAGVAADAHSEEYLAHRAYLLESLLLRNLGDAVTVAVAGRGPELFQDLALALDFTSSQAAAPFPLGSARQYLFGGEGADSLHGADQRDALYGMGGNDLVTGGAQQDHLEGGAGEDTVIGADGSDLLRGDDGADQLDGGDGNDTLAGGEGADLYLFRAGDGIDLISERDSGGDRILFNTLDLSMMHFEEIAPGAGIFLDRAQLGISVRREGQSLYIRKDDTPAAGAVIVQTWMGNGDFGIVLPGVDPPAPPPGLDPAGALLVQGDRAPIDADPETPGVQQSIDALGNVVTDPLQVVTRDDVLRGSAGVDRIIGGGGRDLLDAKSGADQLEGGGGTDILAGGDGDDLLFAGSSSDFLLVFDEAAPVTPDKDWLAGGAGADTLVGSGGAEGFSGGAGADLVHGGAGDDHIMGDADIAVTSFDWSWTDDTEAQTRTFNPTIGVADPPGAGEDSLHGGAGNDWIAAGRGNDLVTGGSGNDSASGHAGDDTLDGGAGDDQLSGDSGVPNLAVEEHGDDQLTGGAGNDELSGNGGDDELMGGDGNDELYGDAEDIDAALHGDDTLDGGSGEDSLTGGGGKDQLAGGAGADVVSGDGGDDTVDGGEGDDRLWGDASDLQPAGDGADLLRGEAGADQLVGGGGDDTLDGGTEDDRLWGAEENDVLDGAAGNDLLEGGEGADDLRGGAGTDSLRGDAGEDTLRGGSGNDTLQGNAEADLLLGEGGADLLAGGDGADTLAGWAGADQLLGDAGEDLLDGGGDADELSGGDGADSLEGGLGNDVLFGDAGNDTLAGGAGDDWLAGGDGDDTYLLTANSGNDTLSDGSGTTRLVFSGVAAPTVLALDYAWGAQTVRLQLAGSSLTMSVSEYQALAGLATDAGAFGGAALVRPTDAADAVLLPGTDDEVHAQGGADSVRGGNGDDRLHGEGGSDWLFGEDGGDLLFGGAAQDSLYGGAGADTLSGGDDLDLLSGDDGEDLLQGEASNDSLRGGAGDDTLDGGIGRDTLDGGAGNDTFLFGLGAGVDELRARTPDAGELDTVLFGAGVSPGQVTVRSYGSNDLHLVLPGGEELVLKSYFADPGAPPQIEIRFASAAGETWNYAEVMQRTLSHASEGADTLDGFGGNDTLDGLGGNDALYGGAGNDALGGSAGADTLFGGTGADLLDGGADSDLLQGEAGDDSLAGAAGNDFLEGLDGADRLDGGAGSDTLRGGSGADTYIYARGDGDDLLVERDGETPAPAALDLLQFGSGIAPADITVAPALRDPTGVIAVSNFFELNVDVVFRVAGGGSVTVRAPDDPGLYDSVLDELRFADAPQSVLRWNELIAAMRVPDAGNDLLEGTATAETLDAQAGDDLVFGAEGNDAIFGREGRDSLLGGMGADTLDGGAGDDFLRGGDDPNPNIDQIDHYVWGRGYGHDTVWARPDNFFWTVSGSPFPADVLDLSGVAWAELRAARSGQDLSLWLEGSTDRLTVLGYYSSGHQQLRIRDGSGAEYAFAEIEQRIAATEILRQVSSGDDFIIGSDTVADSIDALSGNDSVEGRGGNDTLSGGDGNDLVQGQAGNDSLLGGAGNDTLAGGAGNDALAGGTGNDHYRFGFGGGSDRIADQDKTTGRIDTLGFEAGVRPDDVRISRNGDDLVLTLADSGESITVAKHFLVKGKDIGYHVDAVSFADGMTWSRTALADLVSRNAAGHYTLAGTAGADVLQGLGGNDTLSGVGGADRLLAGAGDDWLAGGAGTDTLEGGKGADTYDFRRGDGADLVLDDDLSARIDVLQLGSGILPAEVQVFRVGGSDLLVLAGGSDSVRVRDFFTDGAGAGRGIEAIRFADGTVWARAALQDVAALPANSAPQAGADTALATENRSLAISEASLLANDADIDADALAIRAVQAGFGGSVSFDTATRQLGFAPDPYFTGEAWFSYTVSDGTLEAQARVTVQVAIDTGGNARLGTDAANSLTGTRGDDRLYGLAGNDVLRADRGNDQLAGGSGADTLEGAAGNDIYVFQRGDGVDLIDNRSARATDIDSLWFTSGYTRDELWFLREGNDLVIGTGNAADRVIVDEWFGTDVARIDEIHVPGAVIYAAEVERLVQAMAVFDAPAGTGLAFSEDTRGMLEPVIAAAWRPSGAGA